MQCWVPGICDESGVPHVSQLDKDGESCRALCQSDPECLWFSYEDNNLQKCTIYYGECTSFIDKDSTFTSQHSCNRQLKSKHFSLINCYKIYCNDDYLLPDLRRTKVVLVAGSISDREGNNRYSKIVELFDMDSNEDCRIDNYPHFADGPTCTFLKEGNIKCCGGEGPEDMNQCYDYETSSNRWHRTSDLSSPRYWPKSSYVEEGLWMVTGWRWLWGRGLHNIRPMDWYTVYSRPHPLWSKD